jgi:hypothetical protein
LKTKWWGKYMYLRRTKMAEVIRSQDHDQLRVYTRHRSALRTYRCGRIWWLNIRLRTQGMLTKFWWENLFENTRYEIWADLGSRAVCGRLFAGVAGSNPAEDMDVCLLCLYVVQVEVSETGWSLVQRSPTVCLNRIMQKARGNHCIKKILTDIPSISSSWELLQTNLNDWKKQKKKKV